MNIKHIFGNNLQLNRKNQLMSQEQLAEKLNISSKHLSELETGKTFASAELIEKIAENFNVSISSLFYTPTEKSFDKSDIAVIDQIIDNELEKTILSIKSRIREKLKENK
ncbi:MAG: helix-turn-helix domain-containing protein [Treponema sp.]|nr:helix-turn-helix domain-containing protein [Treponema sp.]